MLRAFQLDTFWRLRGNVCARVDARDDASCVAFRAAGSDARVGVQSAGNGVNSPRERMWLAICQELASLMGGSITVESEPGRGARFRVCLPLPSAEVSPENPVTAAHSPARRVLLVEDDDTVSQVIAGLLRAQGHAVSVVPHSLAALSELAVEQFEVALVDLDLPGMDGLTLVRHMRSQGIAFPIVAVTARADPGAIDSAHAAGCDRFLRKPLSGQMLAELMADCIALAETDRKVVEHSAV